MARAFELHLHYCFSNLSFATDFTYHLEVRCVGDVIYVLYNKSILTLSHFGFSMNLHDNVAITEGNNHNQQARALKRYGFYQRA